MIEIFIKPSVKTLLPFDATKDYTVYFNASGGDQFSSINYIIENNLDGSQISDITVASYQTKFIIAANTLTNGVEYRFKIRVGDGSNYGEFSEYSVFKCLSPAIVEIVNFQSDNVIKNQSVLLNGIFTQSEGDTVASYRFIIYDGNGVTIDTQPETFSQTISYMASGFQSGSDYYIELIVSSQAGVVTSTGRIYVTVNYIQPVVHSILELNNTLDGKVRIQAVLSQVRGVANEYATYEPEENPEWINLKDPNALLYINEGLNTVTDDFVLNLWISDFSNGDEICRIHGDNGVINIWFSENRFKALKNTKQMSMIYMSEEVLNILDEEEILLIITSINGRIDLDVRRCG